MVTSVLRRRIGQARLRVQAPHGGGPARKCKHGRVARRARKDVVLQCARMLRSLRSLIDMAVPDLKARQRNAFWVPASRGGISARTQSMRRGRTGVPQRRTADLPGLDWNRMRRVEAVGQLTKHNGARPDCVLHPPCHGPPNRTDSCRMDCSVATTRSRKTPAIAGYNAAQALTGTAAGGAKTGVCSLRSSSRA